MDPVTRIAGIGLNVADVARAGAFYRALGFAGEGGRLAFGRVQLELTPATGAPYPEPRAANDPWFQHFAIAVADIEAAAAGGAGGGGAADLGRRAAAAAAQHRRRHGVEVPRPRRPPARAEPDPRQPLAGRSRAGRAVPRRRPHGDRRRRPGAGAGMVRGARLSRDRPLVEPRARAGPPRRAVRGCGRYRRAGAGRRRAAPRAAGVSLPRAAPGPSGRRRRCRRDTDADRRAGKRNRPRWPPPQLDARAVTPLLSATPARAATIAQSVRAPVCGTGGCGFDPRWSPQPAGWAGEARGAGNSGSSSCPRTSAGTGWSVP